MVTSSAILLSILLNGTAKKTRRATPIFNRGDLVRVPFPFVEENRHRFRPALVISRKPVGGKFGLIWVVMVTGAGHKAWEDDVDVGPAHAKFGLPIPSRIRIAKITAVAPHQASMAGHLDETILAEVLIRAERIVGYNAYDSIARISPPR